jgi:hypothetical protein
MVCVVVTGWAADVLFSSVNSSRGPLGCGKRESERAMALTRIGQDGPFTIQ